MLARLAESLYWMGRYMERTEYISRYLKVQYFSTLDAPINYDTFFSLSAIVNITGSTMEVDEDTKEQDVLYEVVFSRENPSSLINTITQFRQNAKTIRPIISNELWESINTFYVFATNYDVEHFKQRGVYEFTNAVSRNSAVFTALLETTMLHDEVWSFIRLGIHLEATLQTTRVVSNKIFDIDILRKSVIQEAEENYQWLITLKIVAGLDMSTRVYKNIPNKSNTIEFLITNTQFPKSVVFNLIQANEFIHLLAKSYGKYEDKDSLEYYASKVCAYYKFMEIKDVESMEEMLDDIIFNIRMLHEKINSKFFEN